MSIVKLIGTFFKGNTGKALLGGMGAFFGFEWLTNGGMVDSAAGTLGVTDSTATLILILGLVIAGYLAIKLINSMIPAKQHTKQPAKRR